MPWIEFQVLKENLLLSIPVFDSEQKDIDRLRIIMDSKPMLVLLSSCQSQDLGFNQKDVNSFAVEDGSSVLPLKDPFKASQTRSQRNRVLVHPTVLVIQLFWSSNCSGKTKPDSSEADTRLMRDSFFKVNAK